jgi:hypothetical protein
MPIVVIHEWAEGGPDTTNYDRFNDGRLGPGIREVLSGLHPQPLPPRTEIYELYNVIRPSP